MKQIKRALIYLIQLAFQTFTNTSFRGLLVSLEIAQQAPRRSTLIYSSVILLQPQIRGGESTLNPIQQTDAGCLHYCYAVYGATLYRFGDSLASLASHPHTT